MKIQTYHQGDINFIPLEAFGKSAKDVSTATPLRPHKRRLLIQEGKITGHHHGVWFDADVLDRVDGAVVSRMKAAGADAENSETLGTAVEQSTAKAVVDNLMAKRTAGELAPARLYQDDTFVAALELDAGAPVVGFLVCDEAVTIRHASEAGAPTGEHAPIKLPAGGYFVTGKREWSAGDERRVQD